MLILSCFPGLGLLDRGFESEGFCVVRGPDPIWGGDIREFHPPAGVFDGVIGGDPCQSHSGYANLLRSKGMETRFKDLSSEFARVVSEAAPRWFLRENIPQAAALEVDGYAVDSFLLENLTIAGDDGVGQQQRRTRRFWFGVRGVAANDIVKWIPGAALLHPDPQPSVTGRHHSYGMGPAKPGNPPRYSIERALELQGLPADFLDHSPFTMEGKRKAIGNGVPQAMARALAGAIRKAMG